MVLHKCSSRSVLEVKMQMPEHSNFHLPLIHKWPVNNSLKRRLASAETLQLVDKASLNKLPRTISKRAVQSHLAHSKMKLLPNPYLRSNSAKVKFSSAQMSHPKKINNNSMLIHNTSRSIFNLKKHRARSKVKLQLKRQHSS